MSYYLNNHEIENPDNHSLFNLLNDTEKEILLSWIYDNFEPIKSFTTNNTSYGLKQKFSRTNFYVFNGVFKGAMLEAGFKVKNPNDKNWIFNISKKSKFFTRRD